MTTLPPVQPFITTSGVRIYRIPLVLFPNNFLGYSYLLLNAGPPTLVDTGSGMGQSNDDLLRGLRAVRDDFGEAFQLTDIERIIITHGHIDHFGGVAFMVEQTGAEVGIHPLDRRILMAYEERLAIATKDLRFYLEQAGMDEAECRKMIGHYSFFKSHVQSLNVNFTIDEDIELEEMRFIHAPGHCSGQVCILLGDTMLCADHILSQTTPHQAPESITHYTGLGHYLDSLNKVKKVEGIKLALGGHEDPIHDMYNRIDAIYASHQRKLNRIIDIIKATGEPQTIKTITQMMYPHVENYETLLALEEAGAHIEYLYERGYLSVANLDQIEKEENPAVYYTVT